MVRVRPLNNKELSADYRNIVHVDPIHGTVRLDQLNGPDRSRDAPPKVSILLSCIVLFMHWNDNINVLYISYYLANDAIQF